MRSPSVANRILRLPRSGSAEAEYEDAAAVGAEEWPVCAAVADGATESVFARTWAEFLARGLVDRGATTAAALRKAVPKWQAKWERAVADRTEERPWYVEAKTVEGAFAALLGVSLHAGGQWRAVSVGDCCLFHVRDGGLERCWPFETPGAFTNRPALVSSRSGQTMPPPEMAFGTWRTQDTFLLATDAVAAWLLGDNQSQDSAAPPSRPMAAADWDEEAFQTAVEKARAEGSLRNDDATLLVLHVEEDPDVDENDAAVS